MLWSEWVLDCISRISILRRRFKLYQLFQFFTFTNEQFYVIHLHCDPPFFSVASGEEDYGKFIFQPTDMRKLILRHNLWCLKKHNRPSGMSFYWPRYLRHNERWYSVSTVKHFITYLPNVFKFPGHQTLRQWFQRALAKCLCNHKRLGQIWVYNWCDDSTVYWLRHIHHTEIYFNALIKP